jgi:hypothetical protein
MSEQPTAATDAVARARVAALAELRAAPAPTPWRRQAWRLAGAFVATGALAAVAAVAAPIAGWSDVAARALLLAQLLAVAAVAGFAVLAPGLRAARAAVLAAAPLLMAELVLAHGQGLPSQTPEWVCSVSHFALDLLPLGVALWALRQCAWRWTRALAAGAGAGTAGALLGELACQRGGAHVLVHHVGAWLAIVAACVLFSRRARPRTFAP